MGDRLSGNDRGGPAPVPVVRCAVYTRKSTEEGLDPASWRPMNQSAMTPESDEGEALAAMAERIELLQEVK